MHLGSLYSTSCVLRMSLSVLLHKCLATSLQHLPFTEHFAHFVFDFSSPSTLRILCTTLPLLLPAFLLRRRPPLEVVVDFLHPWSLVSSHSLSHRRESNQPLISPPPPSSLHQHHTPLPPLPSPFALGLSPIHVSEELLGLQSASVSTLPPKE
ncbi:hypothetical protein EJ06DRAFT_345835 [Trichodelitschia bisporula]|uniref:Uncharacterized protein n=1 Tax=Trichodelitschia bisporula TaxID=703511 RepID=A0A6G1I3L0_9PEZI|nr:hypothetical protein EJ06DRAFT_345835 [Trichodelitschia bisporula]